MNSNQLISDQFLIKNPNYVELAKKLEQHQLNHTSFYLNEEHQNRFTSANNQFCSCCFLDKNSTATSSSQSPTCSRDSSSSPKSTVTHISNNPLFSDQLSDHNSQVSTETSSNLWCSTPSSTNDLQNSTNVSTESFVLDDKLNTVVTNSNNNSNFLNINTNSTPNRITPTFRSFNQVHQQASKQYQTNRLSLDIDNLNNSFNSKTSNHPHSQSNNLDSENNQQQQFFKPYHHSHLVNNHLLNYLNHPNQHLLFVNQLLAQQTNTYPTTDQTFKPFKSTNQFNYNQQNRLSINHKYQKRKLKSNKSGKTIEKSKTPFVSRLVAKIKAKKIGLIMYRNSSTSTSLQSQTTLNPHGSFHKPGSNVALAWEDINVYKPIPIVDQLAFRLNTNVLGCDEHNLILKQLNGVIKFGEICAIMGPSGLLNLNNYKIN